MKRILIAIALALLVSNVYANFLCADGSWGNCGTATTCPSSTPYKCWDDTCRKNAGDCPPVTKCPARKPNLCPNGTCQTGASACN